MVYNLLYFILARFTPTDQHSKERIRIKERFGLLPTQKPAPIY
jgi:H/ACA ribonucleoprotein complex subunit 3